VLRDVQQQTSLLAYLEQEVGRSKEFLSKVSFPLVYVIFIFSFVPQAVKTNDSAWAPSTEEDIFANISGQTWEDNVYS
jgi:COP9 signalosome complex subunit 3